jgi:hypothetical protein
MIVLLENMVHMHKDPIKNNEKEKKIAIATIRKEIQSATYRRRVGFYDQCMIDLSFLLEQTFYSKNITY